MTGDLPFSFSRDNEEEEQEEKEDEELRSEIDILTPKLH